VNRRSVIGLVAWLILCYAVAAFGSQFTPGAWYDRLAKPSWTPPGWIFGPVWTLLYGLMAVSAWLVWREHGLSGARAALLLFLAQLVLNGAWSWIFFGLERPGVAVIELGVLWVAIRLTLVAFWSLHRVAGLLLVPYLAWVTFAGILNFEIWRLNA
jgi:translocator protein